MAARAIVAVDESAATKFRCGIASGVARLLVHDLKSGAFQVEGVMVGIGSELEAAAAPGQVCVDGQTVDLLQVDQTFLARHEITSLVRKSRIQSFVLVEARSKGDYDF